MRIYTRSHGSISELDSSLYLYFMINHGQHMIVDNAAPYATTKTGDNILGLSTNLIISDDDNLRHAGYNLDFNKSKGTIAISAKYKNIKHIFQCTSVPENKIKSGTATLIDKIVTWGHIGPIDSSIEDIRNQSLYRNTVKYVSFFNEQPYELQLKVYDRYWESHGEKALCHIHEPHEKLMNLIRMSRVLER